MRRFLLLILLLGPGVAIAQDTLRIMSYNLLNFPDPNPAGKADTLRKIIQWSPPVDILVVQELKDSIGADQVLDISLNTGTFPNYSQAEFIPMQSDPFETHRITQHLYYDHGKLTLHDQELLLTAVRDINIYTLYPNSFSPAQDTTFFTIYVVHLKSSQGTANEQLRLSMVDTLLQHMATLPPDRTVMVAGDFNVYTDLEPAFQSLLSNANPIILQDPADEVGDWHNNSAYAPVHSQSTRSSQIFGDGAGGGLDDRFDHILLSTNAMQPWEVLRYVPNSYSSVGNSGDCYNTSITACSGVDIPAHIRWSLYHMSDHLPQYLELVHDPLLTAVQEHTPATTLNVIPAPGGIDVLLHGSDRSGMLNIFDPSGRTIARTRLDKNVPMRIPVRPGAYLITFTNSEERLTRKIMIDR